MTRALAVALILMANPAHGQACASRAEVTARLDGRYSEAPVALGVASNGSIIEVWTTADGATWTIVVTNPLGTSCQILAGKGWETVPHRLKGEKS